MSGFWTSFQSITCHKVEAAFVQISGFRAGCKSWCSCNERVTSDSRAPPGSVCCLRHCGRLGLCDEADVCRALLLVVREVWHRTAAPHKSKWLFMKLRLTVFSRSFKISHRALLFSPLVPMALLLWLFFQTRSNTKTGNSCVQVSKIIFSFCVLLSSVQWQ